uniref:Cob(II)yrinic acid a,c-diamide reductase n=1 Tax=Mycobacterium sp. (strain JLS) TaxID=164757 RepID=A0A5Q5CMZ3_MYCSJ
MTDHAFTDAERHAVYRAITERRDMRRFVPGEKVPDEVLARLLAAAHAAPSVGLMQPWRFIRITDPALRRDIHALVDEERHHTAEALGPRGEEFLALKVEGVLDCAELLVVALRDGRERHVFGRRTLPHMDLASVSCAIQNMWLAARAEGLGMGWCRSSTRAASPACWACPTAPNPSRCSAWDPYRTFPTAPSSNSTGGRWAVHWPSSSPRTVGTERRQWSWPTAPLSSLGACSSVADAVTLPA